MRFPSASRLRFPLRLRINRRTGYSYGTITLEFTPRQVAYSRTWAVRWLRQPDD